MMYAKNTTQESLRDNPLVVTIGTEAVLQSVGEMRAFG
jgi:hypothetical protein